MAKLKGFSLRHNDVDTTQKEGGGALPDGFYRFEVDEFNDKPHYDNRKGYQLVGVLEVIEPEEFKGRKMFVDFSVVDPENPDREAKARDAFGRFLKAIDYNEEFDDPEELIGLSGIAKYGLDRYRSDKQNKRYGRVWAYVYPEDERDWMDKNELGESDRQEEWFPAKQTSQEERGRGREERGRDRGGRGGREERGGREDRGGREERGRDNDRERGRDRDRDEGRGRGRDDRGSEVDQDDDIPFNGGRDEGGERDEDRPRRGGGDNPWNRGNGRGSR